MFLYVCVCVHQFLWLVSSEWHSVVKFEDLFLFCLLGITLEDSINRNGIPMAFRRVHLQPRILTLSSGECRNINNSYLWLSAFWHWWALTKSIFLFVFHFLVMQFFFFIACVNALTTLCSNRETSKSLRGSNSWSENPEDLHGAVS